MICRVPIATTKNDACCFWWCFWCRVFIYKDTCTDIDKDANTGTDTDTGTGTGTDTDAGAGTDTAK